VLGLVIENHPDRALADFGRKPVRCLARHGPIFSRVRASGKSGAVHTAKLMVFKLITADAKTWRKLKGENQLPKVIQGVTFRDGIEVSVPTSQSAA
jgi:hypothetical protein